MLRRREAPAGAPAQALRGARWQHERERARERRAVFVGDPASERDELRRYAQLERAQRLEQALVGDLTALGEADDDTTSIEPTPTPSRSCSGRR
jgi:hypothetical protein